MGSIVQNKEGSGSGTTVDTGSFASNVTAGNFIQVIVYSATADTVTLSQIGGTATIGSIVERGSVTEAGILTELTLLTCAVTGTGSLNLRSTFGSSQGASGIYAIEVTGVSAYQGSDVKTDTGSNPTPNPALTVNVTTQPAFVIAQAMFLQGGTPGVGTGFTDYATFFAGSSRTQYKTVTSTGNTTGDFVNTAIDRANMAMVVWTDGGGGSPALDDSGVYPGFEAQTSPIVISIW